LIEKPAVENVAQFEELESLAERHGVPVSVVTQHLYDPAMRSARAQIEDGRLGDVRGVDLVFTGLTPPNEPNRGSWTFELPGGEFEEGIPHPIYLTLAAGGYPADEDDVHATTSLHGEYEHDFSYDNAQVQCAAADGTLCSIKMLSGAIPQRVLLIHAEERSLVVDFISQTVEKLDRNYRGSPVRRVLNNVDRAGDRLWGVVDNGRLMAKKMRDDSWDVQRKINPHYYQINREARALERGSDLRGSLERAKWTTITMEKIRNTGERRPIEGATPTQD
jgi:predicted dehydrogenase